MPLYAPAAGDYREYADRASFDVSAELSVAVWVRAATIASLGVIVARGTQATPTAAGGWAIRLQDPDGGGIIRFAGSVRRTGGTMTAIGPTTEVAADTDYHVCLTFSSAAGELKLYVNGELERTSTTSSGNMAAASTAIRTHETTTGAGHLDGTLAHLGVWNVTLSGEEVRTLYRVPPHVVRQEAAIIADALRIGSADVAGNVVGTDGGNIANATRALPRRPKGGNRQWPGAMRRQQWEAPAPSAPPRPTAAAPIAEVPRVSNDDAVVIAALATILGTRRI